MAISPQGIIIARLKAETGLTWKELAGVIGSSPDFIRKVAEGKRPGKNLAANLDEVMQRGEASAPVPRRRTRAGTLAKVRTPARTGVKSARPAENRVRTPGQIFRAETGLGWSQLVGNPDTAAGAAAFKSAIASAGRGKKRVAFRVLVKDPTTGRARWVQVGGKGGYKPATVSAGVKKYGSPAEWLATQAPNAAGSSLSALSSSDLLDIEIIAS